MAKGGQQLEARKTRSIGADGAEAMATEERQPVSNPGDIERALARFAEAAVSSPAVSEREKQNDTPGMKGDGAV